MNILDISYCSISHRPRKFIQYEKYRWERQARWFSLYLYRLMNRYSNSIKHPLFFSIRALKLTIIIYLSIISNKRKKVEGKDLGHSLANNFDSLSYHDRCFIRLNETFIFSLVYIWIGLNKIQNIYQIKCLYYQFIYVYGASKFLSEIQCFLSYRKEHNVISKNHLDLYLAYCRLTFVFFMNNWVYCGTIIN